MLHPAEDIVNSHCIYITVLPFQTSQNKLQKDGLFIFCMSIFCGNTGKAQKPVSTYSVSGSLRYLLSVLNQASSPHGNGYYKISKAKELVE